VVVDAALELSGVGKSWPGFALRDVSFRVPPGHITGLVGPNGAGKTTLVRIVLDLVRADTGRVRVFGCDHRAAGPVVRSRIGFVHDRPICYGHLPVERLGALVASFYPTWDEETFRRTVREFEVPPRRKVSALSRGMKVKLGLALALSHRAELLVLDEPTTGLDPVFRRELLHRLSGLITDGRTAVLFSTQILSDLERIADFVVFLRRGTVLYEGVKDDLVDRWAVVRAAPDVASELEGLPVRGMRTTKMGIEALVADHEAARRRLGERAVVERATLDDVFLMLDAPWGEQGRS
jgi:ABC-2 type transport system ATP-binding protein